MANSPLRQAIEEFKRARREHAHDLHDPVKAEALRLARQQLDGEAAQLLRRLPFRVRPVTEHAHLAVTQVVELRSGWRYPGQTLCGAPSGRPSFGHPAPCERCLLAAERYLAEGPPAPELEL